MHLGVTKVLVCLAACHQPTRTAEIKKLKVFSSLFSRNSTVCIMNVIHQSVSYLLMHTGRLMDQLQAPKYALIPAA
jgi:hypothetical protein